MRPTGSEFLVGDWLVQPSLNRVSAAGTIHHLRPKVMDVLVLLASRPGEVITKDDVLETVWAKRFIAESALAGAVCELRDILGDDAQSPRFVETIPKRGYRLVAPVTPAGTESTQQRPPTRAADTHFRPSLALLLTAATVVLLVVTLLVGTTGQASRSTGRQRIAVLPFENLGGVERAYFAAGMTDEITSRLAGLRDLQVVSRSSAAEYRGSDKGNRVVGRELDVDFVLRGTVRWSDAGDHIRISLRLVRAEDDTHIWADVYDRSIDDVLDVQAEIARTVAEQLHVTLFGDEASAVSSRPTSNPEAYQAYLKGAHHFEQVESEESQLLAVCAFERAVQLDPDFAEAWARLSTAHLLLYHFGFDRTEARRSAGLRAAQRAAALDPDGATPHIVMADYHHMAETDYALALEEARAAEAIAGPGRNVLASQGYILRRMGRMDESLAKLQQAVRFSPRDAWLACELGVTRSLDRQFDAANRDYDRAIEISPDQHTAYEWRAYNALVAEKSTAAARRWLSEMPALPRPSVILAWWLLELCDGNTDEALAWISALANDICSVQFQYYPRSLLAAQALEIAGDRQGSRDAYAQAIARLERDLRDRPIDDRIHSALAIAYAGLGRGVEAARSAQRAIELCPRDRDAIRGAFPLITRAQTQVMLGDLDAAVATLDELLELPLHPFATPLLELDPRWSPLRSHPAFASLVSRLTSRTLD